MKTSLLARSLVLAPLALVSATVAVAAPIAPPTPDLVITKVVENGTVAVVQIRNVGSAFAGASSLRVWHNFGFGWFITATIPVAPIPPGTTFAVTVSGAGITAPENYYMTDVFNAVPELLESNNTYHTP